MKRFVRTLAGAAGRLWSEVRGLAVRSTSAGRRDTPAGPADAKDGQLRRLRRVLVTSGVSETIFREYGEHLAGPRGREETGWALLGVRGEDEALVMATLPAGVERDAGRAHVRFNSAAQALASRVVRQSDKRLTLLGVLHTHPGSLRHPSQGDYRGDSVWVERLRGREGVFGIGTADAPRDGSPGDGVAWQPGGNVQCLGPCRLSWYSLGKGDRRYNEVPVSLTLGPDLAGPLRPVWPAVEAHAERLDRLARQQVGVKFEPAGGAVLAVTVPLATPGDAVRIEIEGDAARYFVLLGGDVMAVDLPGKPVDQAVYLILSELAARP